MTSNSVRSISPIARVSVPCSWSNAVRACSGVTASIRSATASACARSSRPFRYARSVNSPGSASRAPRAIAASTMPRRITGLPCALISTTSSPVYDAGAGKPVTITVIDQRPDRLSGCPRASRAASSSARIARASSRTRDRVRRRAASAARRRCRRGRPASQSRRWCQ